MNRALEQLESREWSERPRRLNISGDVPPQTEGRNAHNPKIGTVSHGSIVKNEDEVFGT
jgi:hypothetical protein